MLSLKALYDGEKLIEFDSKMEYYNNNDAPREEIESYIMERANVQLSNYEENIQNGYLLITSISIVMIIAVIIFAYTSYPFYSNSYKGIKAFIEIYAARGFNPLRNVRWKR